MGPTPASTRAVSSRTYTCEGSARFAPVRAMRPAGDSKVPVTRPSPSSLPAAVTPSGFASAEMLGAVKVKSRVKLGC